MAKKRVYKSGHQKRKERAQREKVASVTNLVASQSWGTSPTLGYQNASAQWDPSAPPSELPLYGQPPATQVKQVAQALLQLEQGAFYASSYLWDGMTRDDRIAATMGQRIDRLIGSPLEFQPADEEEASAQDIADECAKMSDDVMPPWEIYELMRTALGLSVGIAQIVETETDGVKHSTMRVWNNRWLRFDWMLRKYRLITENRGEITLEYDDPEWIIYEPYGPKGWLHGALIRSVVQPWLIRLWTRTWWARESEVHGQPLRLGIIPADRTPDDEKKFLGQLSNLAHEAVIRLPQGLDGNKFDVKLLEASTNTWEGFSKLLEHCDDSIAISILGQRQSTKGQTGLSAQENAGESTMARITRKDALVGKLLRKKLWKPFVKDVLGADPAMAPSLDWQSEPPEDENATAKTDLAVAQSLVAFKAASAPLDVRQFLDSRGYPLLSEADHAAQQQAAVQQAQQAMQPPGDVQPGDETQPPSEETKTA